MADYVEVAGVQPMPASTTLDAARRYAFTGEITFLTEPNVRTYHDGGVVYHAERDGDPSVREQLLAAGVIDTRQLERGVVRVGDVEHLGRLFDRDETVDRDAVMVLVESRTDELVNDLATHAVTRAAVSAYRHHPSGIHRWFVAPIDVAASTRPVSAVNQVDRSVVDDLPGLGRSHVEMTIEWSEPDPSPLGLPHPLVGLAAPSDADVQAELDRFDADHADWSGVVPVAGSAPNTHPSPLGEFHIVWPNGTEVDAIAGTAVTVDPLAPTQSTIDNQRHFDEPRAADLAAVDLPEPLVVEALPHPDAAVPDDVAAAVKRALQAIDEASAQPISVPRLDLAPIALPSNDSPQRRHETPDEATPTVAGPEPLAAPMPASPMVGHATSPVGFAPPTADMRAEVVYERAAAAGVTASTADAHHEPGQASVVFVEDDAAKPADRKSALRRLISSLRGND